jgi:hypothetical protein
MLKSLLTLSLALLFACGGALTDEQRKKIKEEMIRGTIQKVSDAEITEAAFDKGRRIADLLPLSNRHKMDSLQKVYTVRIGALQPGDSTLLTMEKMIVEAYIASDDAFTSSDNLQAIGPDTLLFTRPVMKRLSDGKVAFEYALGIRMPKRDVILSLREK